MKEGYIYIYKCIVGAHSDICKIGRTKHFEDNCDRLKQHVRTTYYGFTAYTEFTTGKPIATLFKVKNLNKADHLIKKYFKEYQVSSIEIYNIDYDDAIEKIYYYLKENEQLIELIKEDFSAYEFLNRNSENDTINTTKSAFEKVKQELLLKYPDEIPYQLLVLLRDIKEFQQNCPSHFRNNHFIEFPNGLVLDINFNKAKRVEILNKLKQLL